MKPNEALARGHDGMRVAASAPSLAKKDWDEFLTYEEKLNAYVADKVMLLLCAYPLATGRAAEILRVARTHPSALVK